ncbi:GTP-binding protein Rhes isoform X2 [Brachyhypopomus gauderio]|uniref:GTP-binding protein Rhes isoform X2 n=1 Tax=Brachyhypopomus gauderio TaxID=698409 RepID=UPI004040FA54
MQERRLEVNAAERVIISADGAKTFRSCDRTPDHIATAGARLLRPDEHIKNYVSSIARLHYTNATSDQNTRGYKIPQVSKTKMGIIKTVTLQWKHFEKKPRVVRSSSISHRHSSADRLPRRSLDPQTAVLFQGETESNDLDCSAKEGELRLVKSNHYRRVVVLGAPRVGKTAILRRFLTGGFEQRYVPTTEDFYSKLYHIRGEAYQIDLLDASKERDYPAKRRLSILTGRLYLTWMYGSVGGLLFRSSECMLQLQYCNYSPQVTSFSWCSAWMIKNPLMSSEKRDTKQKGDQSACARWTMRRCAPARASTKFQQRSPPGDWTNDAQTKPTYRQVSDTVKSDIRDSVSNL